MLVKWVAELDLGRKILIEVKEINRPGYDRLVAGFNDTAGIGQVYPREFDSRLFSKIEVESRLTADQLKDEVLKALPGHRLDRLTRGYLQFTPGKRAAPVGAAQDIVPGGRAQSSGLPVWAWAWIGAGGALGLLFVFQAGKRSRG